MARPARGHIRFSSTSITGREQGESLGDHRHRQSPSGTLPGRHGTAPAHGTSQAPWRHPGWTAGMGTTRNSSFLVRASCTGITAPSVRPPRGVVTALLWTLLARPHECGDDAPPTTRRSARFLACAAVVGLGTLLPGAPGIRVPYTGSAGPGLLVDSALNRPASTVVVTGQYIAIGRGRTVPCTSSSSSPDPGFPAFQNGRRLSGWHSSQSPTVTCRLLAHRSPDPGQFRGRPWRSLKAATDGGSSNASMRAR